MSVYVSEAVVVRFAKLAAEQLLDVPFATANSLYPLPPLPAGQDTATSWPDAVAVRLPGATRLRVEMAPPVALPWSPPAPGR